MALLKEDYKNQYGVLEQYWKVIGININLQLKYCDITIGGYTTQEARDNGSEYMNIKKVRAIWSDEEFGSFFSTKALSNKSLYNNAYEYLKTDKFFKDAIDV